MLIRWTAIRMPDLEPIIGRYLNLEIAELSYRIFFEEAGAGIPLLCLHTAGRRQPAIPPPAQRPGRYRAGIASSPSTCPITAGPIRRTAGGCDKYLLTTTWYLELVRAVWTALDLERPVVIGCSMGGAIVLKLAAEYQRELRGIIGLESSAFAPGRYNDYLHHPAIHGSELVASYTYGLCAPNSPEASRRENWWYYSQSGPGVYAGDVHYYSMDWDGREDIKTHRHARCARCRC